MKNIYSLIKKVFNYIQGNIRYFFYYHKDGKYRFLIRDHIIQQFELRLKLMDDECYLNGECKICGCKTTALQFAKKQCGKPCYPPLMNYADWLLFQLVEMYARPFKKVYESETEYYLDIYEYFKTKNPSILNRKYKNYKKTPNELLYNK